MSRVEAMIGEMARDGLQIHLWPCAGGYQASVKERASSGWTCVTEEDPLLALAEAMRLRLGGVATRTVSPEPEPDQIDIEDAIAEASGGYTARLTEEFSAAQAAGADDFEALLG